MLTPRALNFSVIVNCHRVNGSIVEITRWHSGPNYRTVLHVYRLTPSSSKRLSIIFSGLRDKAH